jgi:MFS family permease
MPEADVERLRRSHPEYVAAAERNLRRNYLLMTGDQATFAFAIALLSETTILPAFVKSLTAAPLALGLLAAIFAIGHYAPQLVGAHLSMGRARRKPLVFAIALAERVGILAIALVAQLQGVVAPEAVLVLFFLVFAGYATTTGLIGPPYGELFSKSIVRYRGRFYGGVQLLGGLLGALGALVATRILATLPEPTGIQVVFWIAFALSFLSLGFIWNFREEPFPDAVPREPFSALVRGVPGLLRRHEAYRWFLAGRSVVALGTMGVGFLAASALDRGLTAADAALFASFLLVAQSVGGLGLGLVGDRFGWKVVLIATGLALSAAMLVAMVAAGIAAFALAFALVGLVNAGAMTSDPNLTFEVAPPEDTSRYLGITSTLIAPALIVAPLLGAAIAAVTSYTLVFAVSAGLALAGMVLLALRFTEPRRTGAVARPPTMEVQG